MTDAIKESITPATFNFAATVMDRSYPEIDVPVYLNERSIQSLLDIYKERAELEGRIANMGKPGVEYAKKLNELSELYDLTKEELKSEEYTVKIKGIAPEESAKLEAKSYEVYPREFEEKLNSITGTITRTEVENDERDKLFATLLRQAHIVSVTAPNGAVDADFADLDKVSATFARLPLLARAKVDEAINNTTIQVDFYRELVDEVF